MDVRGLSIDRAWLIITDSSCYYCRTYESRSRGTSRLKSILEGGQKNEAKSVYRRLRCYRERYLHESIRCVACSTQVDVKKGTTTHACRTHKGHR